MKGSKAIIAVLAIIIIVLAGASLYLYMDNANLRDQINKLTSENQDLQNEVQSLTDIKANLQAQVNQLQSQISELQSQINHLENEVSNLNSMLNLRRYRVIAEDDTTNFPAYDSTVWYYEVDASHAGYLYISFSATAKARITVVGSYHGYNYYYEILSGGGNYIVPILPGTVYVNMENPNLFTSLIITITIYYYY